MHCRGCPFFRMTHIVVQLGKAMDEALWLVSWKFLLYDPFGRNLDFVVSMVKYKRGYLILTV